MLTIRAVQVVGARLDTLGASTAVELPLDTSGVEGFAELFIAAHLGAGEDTIDALDRFVDGVVLNGVEAGSWSAVATTSLGAQQLSPGYYAVEVAAEVVATDPEFGDHPVGVRHFSVGVAETTTGWVVVGLPALIPRPPRVTAPELLVGRFDGLHRTSGLKEMLPRFLAALLTSNGELTRYTSPSSPIAAVQPPPFTSIEVLQSGVIETPDGLTEVAVLVRGTDADGRTQILEYALVVEQRDERWEVSRLLPAPTLAPSGTN